MRVAELRNGTITDDGCHNTEQKWGKSDENDKNDA